MYCTKSSLFSPIHRRYFIVASNMVRPGQIYRIIVTVYQTQLQPNEIEVRASLLHNGVDIGSDMKLCQQNVPETLMILVSASADHFS